MANTRHLFMTNLEELLASIRELQREIYKFEKLLAQCQLGESKRVIEQSMQQLNDSAENLEIYILRTHENH